jgi:hypothetical protein
MTDITVERLPVDSAAPERAGKDSRKGFFRRIFDAMIEARVRQAEAIVREIRNGRHPVW